MSRCKVAHVDVIPDAGTVSGLVVVSEYADFLPLSACDFHHYGQEVCRILFKSVKNAFRVVPRCVEISECREMKSLELFVPSHEFLNLELGESVIVRRILRVVFIERDVLWFTENGCT